MLRRFFRYPLALWKPSASYYSLIWTYGILHSYVYRLSRIAWIHVCCFTAYSVLSKPWHYFTAPSLVCPHVPIVTIRSDLYEALCCVFDSLFSRSIRLGSGVIYLVSYRRLYQYTHIHSHVVSDDRAEAGFEVIVAQTVAG